MGTLIHLERRVWVESASPVVVAGAQHHGSNRTVDVRAGRVRRRISRIAVVGPILAVSALAVKSYIVQELVAGVFLVAGMVAVAFVLAVAYIVCRDIAGRAFVLTKRSFGRHGLRLAPKAVLEPRHPDISSIIESTGTDGAVGAGVEPTTV